MISILTYRHLFHIFMCSCLDDLACFQRDGTEEVPGCFGTGMAGIDYCFKTTGGSMTVPMDPTAPATIPESQGTTLMTITGTTTPGMPLGLCQGKTTDDMIDDP